MAACAGVRGLLSPASARFARLRRWGAGGEKDEEWGRAVVGRGVFCMTFSVMGESLHLARTFPRKPCPPHPTMLADRSAIPPQELPRTSAAAAVRRAGMPKGASRNAPLGPGELEGPGRRPLEATVPAEQAENRRGVWGAAPGERGVPRTRAEGRGEASPPFMETWPERELRRDQPWNGACATMMTSTIT